MNSQAVYTSIAMRSRSALLIGAVGLLLGSCASPAVTTFDLGNASASISSRSSGGAALTIMEPVALQTFDSNTIVVRAASGDLTMLTDVQWADRLPRLIQTQLVRSFENAGRLGRVGRPNDGLVTDRQLNTEIRQFNIDSTTGEAVVELSVRVIETLSGRVTKARIFSARVPAGAISGTNAAAVLDSALAKVLAEIVVWA